MDILNILTTGITGIVAGALFVFLAVNFLKAGWFGPLSRWVTSVDKTTNKEVYGGRVLFMSFIFSIVVNILQTIASSDPVNLAMCALRIIACSFLASGGYEYIKTIAKNLPRVKDGD